jgi:hypothetical protein
MRTVVPDRGPRRKCRVASDSTAARYGGFHLAARISLDGVRLTTETHGSAGPDDLARM